MFSASSLSDCKYRSPIREVEEGQLLARLGARPSTAEHPTQTLVSTNLLKEAYQTRNDPEILKHIKSEKYKINVMESALGI
jgi:hypothetical protein